MTKLRTNEEYETLNKHEHKTLNKILWNTNTKQTWTQNSIAMWNTRFKKEKKKRRIYNSKQILNIIQLLKKDDHRILNKCGIQHSSKVKTTKQLTNTKQGPATRVNHSGPVSFTSLQGALSFRRSTLRNSSRSEGTWCVPGMLGRCWNSIWVKSAWISPWCLFYTCCIPEQVK